MKTKADFRREQRQRETTAMEVLNLMEQIEVASDGLPRTTAANQRLFAQVLHIIEEHRQKVLSEV